MYLFPDCLILYCAEMHNGNMPQGVSSSFTTANPFLGKIGTFFSYLMLPSQCVSYVLLLFAWPLYQTALCFCLWSLCSWVALWVLGGIQKFTSPFCLVQCLYQSAQSLLGLLVHSAFPQLWKFFHSQELLEWCCGCRRSCLLLWVYQDTVEHSWYLANLSDVLAKVIQTL